MIVSRRAYLLARPSANLMRAAGAASASAPKRAAEAMVQAEFEALLLRAGAKVDGPSGLVTEKRAPYRLTRPMPIIPAA